MNIREVGLQWLVAWGLVLASVATADDSLLTLPLSKEPLVFENGYITPPSGPGLGVEFDQEVLKAHQVE